MVVRLQPLIIEPEVVYFIIAWLGEFAPRVCIHPRPLIEREMVVRLRPLIIEPEVVYFIISMLGNDCLRNRLDHHLLTPRRSIHIVTSTV